MQLPDLFLLLFLEQFEVAQLGLSQCVLVDERRVVVAVEHLLRGGGHHDAVDLEAARPVAGLLTESRGLDLLLGAAQCGRARLAAAAGRVRAVLARDGGVSGRITRWVLIPLDATAAVQCHNVSTLNKQFTATVWPRRTTAKLRMRASI